MSSSNPTPTELSCAISHRRVLEVVRLRERIFDAMDAIDLDHGPRSNAARWDRLWHVLSLVESRLRRRRIAWLELQAKVFDELRVNASSSVVRSDAAESAQRLLDAVAMYAVRR